WRTVVSSAINARAARAIGALQNPGRYRAYPTNLPAKVNLQRRGAVVFRKIRPILRVGLALLRQIGEGSRLGFRGRGANVDGRGRAGALHALARARDRSVRELAAHSLARDRAAPSDERAHGG